MSQTIIETIEQRREHIEAVLAQHHGSLDRNRDWTGRILYTPGVHDMAELCQAFWLIDLVASHQFNSKVSAEPFQVWTLTVAEDKAAIARATDGNEPDDIAAGRNDTALATQRIEYTDFPLGGITLYLADGMLMLPGEY